MTLPEERVLEKLNEVATAKRLANMVRTHSHMASFEMCLHRNLLSLSLSPSLFSNCLNALSSFLSILRLHYNPD